MFEDFLHGLRRDADAGVFDADAHVGFGVGLLHQGDANDHLAFLGELDRIAQQVRDHLAQAERVAPKGQWRVVGVELHRQFEAFGFGRLRHHRQRFLDRVGQTEVHRFQFQMPAFDFREVQDVVDDAQQMAPRCLHRFGPDALRGLQFAVDEQFVHAQHAVHRRADLVAHRGQELALGLARGFGHLHCMLELLGARGHFRFQMVAVGGQAGVTLVNLFEHRVEAVAQGVEFGNAGAPRAHAEVALFRHAVHQLVQAGQGPQHRRVQAAQQDAVGHQGQQRRQPGGGHLPAGLSVQAGQSDPQHQPPCRAGGGLHQLPHHQVGRLQQQIARSSFEQRRRPLAVPLVIGKQMAVLVVQSGDLDVGRVAQRLQQLAGGFFVAECQRRRRVLGQHACLDLAGLNE